MTKGIRMLSLTAILGVMLLQTGCICCFCATPVRRNPLLDRLRNVSSLVSQRPVSRTSARFIDLNDTQVLELEVEDDATYVDLQARIQLDAGAVQWTLVDSLGRPRWEGDLSQRRTVREQHRFEASAGTWRLEIEFRDASGEYDVVWVAR
jgi:hypothetical protein